MIRFRLMQVGAAALGDGAPREGAAAVRAAARRDDGRVYDSLLRPARAHGHDRYRARPSLPFF